MDDRHAPLTAPQILVAMSDLPPLGGRTGGALPGRFLLEGNRYGLDHLTLVMGETAPGLGAHLHRHTYEELFIVHGGRGTYTVGEVTVEAGAGDVVLVPSGVPHGFTNNAQETLFHTAVHASGNFAAERIDSPDTPYA
ncbi:MAG TPA: cupin domain-containing protein [Chloroflexota bacterium]|nr:cupin domain-containing protein [Chloroflexota bacterium]